MSRKRRGRGEGGIFQRGDGLWVGSLSLGYKPDGRRDRRTVYGSSKLEVQAKLRTLQAAHYLGELREPSTMTVAAWLTCWLDGTVKPRWSPTTHTRWEQLVRLHITPHVGHLRLQKFEPLHVHGLMTALERRGASAWTRKMVSAVLHNAFVAARRFKLVTTNPLEDIPQAKPGEREMQILTEVQLRRFLAAARPRRLAALFVLAAGSGMRQGELLGLAWDDIDFQAGTVTVRQSLAQTKGGFVLKAPKSRASRRTIQLSQSVLASLNDHRRAMLAEGNARAPVFCTRTGQYIGKSNLLRQVFRPVVAEAMKADPEPFPAVRFHDLRHTHASLLLRAGESIKALSGRLGHSDVALALRVNCHVLPDADGVLAERFERMIG